jgi:hypothetical protein
VLFPIPFVPIHGYKGGGRPYGFDQKRAALEPPHAASANTKMIDGPRDAKLRVVLPAVLIVSSVLAVALYLLTGYDYPFYGDEGELLSAAHGIARAGIFSAYPHSHLRTYLFPLILSALPAQRAFIFAANLVAYEAAVAFFLVAFVARNRPKNVWLTAVALACNPFALLYVGYALTEALSFAFILVYAGLLVRAGDTPSSKTVLSFFLGIALGCAVMVRPSNLFLLSAAPILFLPDWRGLPLAAQFRSKLSAAFTRLLAFAVGCCLVFFPQFHNNLKYHGAATPLIAVYQQTMVADAQLIERSIKYATAVSPKKNGPAIPALYLDPYREARASENPLVRVAARLAKRATTVIALIDQDRPLPYNRTMFPWYRFPASFFSLAMFFVGLAGIGAELARSWRRPGTLVQKAGAWFDRETLPVTVVAVLAVGCLAAFTRFHTEARYGLPALVLVSPCISHAWSNWGLMRVRARLGLSLAFAAWLALGLGLSFWLDRTIVT